MESKRQEAVLGNEILEIFRPFYLYSIILCAQKYQIKYNTVSRVSKPNIAFAVLGSCVLLILFIFVSMYTNFTTITSSVFMYHLVYISYLFIHVVVCLTNVYYSCSYVRILSNLHEICESFSSRQQSTHYKIISWASLISIISFDVVLVIFKLCYDRTWTVTRAVYLSTSILIDIEISQVVLIVHILKQKTKLWNDKVLKMNIEENEEVSIDRKRELKEMHTVMKLIIQSWSLTSKSSEFKVNIIF